MENETLRNILLGIGTVALVAGVLAFGFLMLAIVQLRRIKVPPTAGFAETMTYVPLTLALFLDFLDLALDIFAAPISWVILSRLGLPGLRGVTAVEALLPFTQALPTMTIAWIGIRLLGKERFEARDVDRYITIDQKSD